MQGISFVLTPGVDSSLRSILEQSMNNKCEQNLYSLECPQLVSIRTNGRFTIVNCKPRTLNDVR